METYKEYLDNQIKEITYDRIYEALAMYINKVGLGEAEGLIDEAHYNMYYAPIDYFIVESMCYYINEHRKDKEVESSEESTVYKISGYNSSSLLRDISKETGLPVSQVYIHKVAKDTLMKMVLKQKLMNTALETLHQDCINKNICLEVQMEANNKQALHIYCTGIKLQELKIHASNSRENEEKELLLKFMQIIKAKGKNSLQLVQENIAIVEEAQQRVEDRVCELINNYESDGDNALNILYKVTKRLEEEEEEEQKEEKRRKREKEEEYPFSSEFDFDEDSFRQVFDTIF